MRQHDTDAVIRENTGFGSGPSGTRTRDLRIKRPSTKTTLRGGNSDAARMAAEPPRHTRGTHESGSSSIGLKIGARVRITAGLAVGKVGVVVESWPTHFGGIPQWVVASDDLVRRRVVRADYLELAT